MPRPPDTESCKCTKDNHETKLVVLTGGPGAGKSAVLAVAKKTFCRHVAILPEAAGIIYSGGFWRKEGPLGHKASQRAIFHVAKELEGLAMAERQYALGLCDRGTVDGLAYWPEEEATFWRDVGSSKEREFAKYSLVIHLRTPPAPLGYNHANPIRIESPEEAHRLDNRLVEVWKGHPRRVFVDSARDFVEKTAQTLDWIRKEIPSCCAPKNS